MKSSIVFLNDEEFSDAISAFGQAIEATEKMFDGEYGARLRKLKRKFELARADHIEVEAAVANLSARTKEAIRTLWKQGKRVPAVKEVYIAQGRISLKLAKATTDAFVEKEGL